MTVEQATTHYILDERMQITEKVEILEWKGKIKKSDFLSFRMAVLVNLSRRAPSPLNNWLAFLHNTLYSLAGRFGEDTISCYFPNAISITILFTLAIACLFLAYGLTSSSTPLVSRTFSLVSSLIF